MKNLSEFARLSSTILAILLFLLPIGVLAQQSPLPPDFASFVLARNGSELAQKLASGTTRILLPQGQHEVDNPLTLTSDKPLYLHGAGRMQTRLVPRDPARPLFVLETAPSLQIGGVSFFYPSGSTTAGVELRQRRPSRVEILDSFFQYTGLVIRGPGDVVVQGSHFKGGGGSVRTRMPDAILLDHNDAALYLVGGNISIYGHAHVYQRRGHLEIYGTGLQMQGEAADSADIVVSSASPSGAHQVKAIRSEGTKTATPSVFMRVLSSNEAVNVVLAANNFTSPPRGSKAAERCEEPIASDLFLDYRAKGSVWLLGNLGLWNTSSLIANTPAAARIFAFGNVVKGCLREPDRLSRVFASGGSASVVQAANLYDAMRGNDATPAPRRRFIEPLNTESLSVPAVPEGRYRGVIPKVSRPTLQTAPPESFLVSVEKWRNTKLCRNASDDGCFLQQALRQEGARLYFPAGVYRISAPLELAQRPREIGGMLAGAGSGRTVIECTCGEVLRSSGMAYVTVQGIRFVAGLPYAQQGAVVRLEWPDKIGGRVNPLFPTQGNNFYDIATSGGKYGIAIGAESSRQCSENLFVDSRFERATLAFAVGSYNALANNLHGVRFADNDWNIGFSDEAIGGTWGIFGAEATGTRVGVIRKYSIGRNLYHNGFVSDGNTLLSIGWNSNETVAYFEHSRFSPASPADPYVLFHAGEGIFLVNSSIEGPVRIDMGGGASHNALLAFQSRLSLDPKPNPGVCVVPSAGFPATPGCATFIAEFR